MSCKRFHHTDSDAIDLERKYLPTRPEFPIKPAGLWYSLGSEWYKWCESAGPEWKRDNCFSIDLDESKLLVIADRAQLADFNKEFLVPALPGQTKIMYPDWDRVVKRYAGIEFRNYYSYRNSWFENVEGIISSMWISSIDVPSGCVWDLTAVKSVQKTKWTTLTFR